MLVSRAGGLRVVFSRRCAKAAGCSVLGAAGFDAACPSALRERLPPLHEIACVSGATDHLSVSRPSATRPPGVFLFVVL